MSPAESAAKKTDRGGWIILLGIVGSLIVSGAIIYFVKGFVVGGGGVKGSLLGTVVGFIGAVIFSALVEPLKRFFASAQAKTRFEVARSFVQLGIAALVVYLVVVPLFRADPTSYYYGAPTAQYRVTYLSGKEELRSGAELATEKWEFRTGACLAGSLVFATMALASLAQNLRRREG